MPSAAAPPRFWPVTIHQQNKRRDRAGDVIPIFAGATEAADLLLRPGRKNYSRDRKS